MTMTVKRLSSGSETWASANKCSSAEIEYLVLNPTSKSAAIAAVLAVAPSSYGENNLPFKEVRFDGFENGCINCAAVYASSSSGSSGNQPDERTTVNFDCGSGTLHRVNAIRQKCVYAAEGETQDSDEVASAVQIGWNGKTGSESEAAGVDVSVGQLRETYTKWMKASEINKRNMARLVGKVNSSTFRGWEAGECMFMGCSYSAPLQGSDDIQVSFHFNIQLNESNAKVSGVDVGSKEGFEYLWAITNDKVENGKSVRKVKKIYRAVVCDKDNFGSLGL